MMIKIIIIVLIRRYSLEDEISNPLGLEKNEAGEFIDDEGDEVVYCACGCGELIKLTSNYKWKRKKGQWKGFKRGHNKDGCRKLGSKNPNAGRKQIFEMALPEDRKPYQDGEHLYDILLNEKWVTKDELGKDFGVSSHTIARYLSEIGVGYSLIAGMRAENLAREGQDVVVFYPKCKQRYGTFDTIATLIDNPFLGKTNTVACRGFGRGWLSKWRGDYWEKKIRFTLRPTETHSIYKIISERVLKVRMPKELLFKLPGGPDEAIEAVHVAHGSDVEIEWSEKMKL